jgi:hypothetical protein
MASRPQKAYSCGKRVCEQFLSKVFVVQVYIIMKDLSSNPVCFELISTVSVLYTVQYMLQEEMRRIIVDF